MVGDAGRSRTCDPQLRRLLLYPTELRHRSLIVAPIQPYSKQDINPVSVRRSFFCLQRVGHVRMRRDSKFRPGDVFQNGLSMWLRNLQYPHGPPSHDPSI